VIVADKKGSFQKDAAKAMKGKRQEQSYKETPAPKKK
jgi:hypothetical protein